MDRQYKAKVTKNQKNEVGAVDIIQIKSIMLSNNYR